MEKDLEMEILSDESNFVIINPWAQKVWSPFCTCGYKQKFTIVNVKNSVRLMV
jgi:hypothetical protein